MSTTTIADTTEMQLIRELGTRKGYVVRTCERCGSRFESPRKYVRQGGGRFCSPQCRAIHLGSGRDTGVRINDDGTATIPLPRGQEAIIDAEDVDLVRDYIWYTTAAGYVRNDKAGYLHRLIANPVEGQITDHIDGDPLNNRRSNLRPGTCADNTFNRGPTRLNKSGYKGVSLHKQTGKWVALIQKDRQRHHLGLFDTPQEAARAYDHKARELHGEFAWLNFPEGTK